MTRDPVFVFLFVYFILNEMVNICCLVWLTENVWLFGGGVPFTLALLLEPQIVDGVLILL